MVNGEPTCSPKDETACAERSYPSGHTSIGWAWALILSEIAPDRADAIQARGRNYGEPPGVQRALAERHPRRPLHGARRRGPLHDNAAFNKDLLAARKEIEAARKAGRHSSRDCATENAVLKVRPQSAL